MSLIIGEIEKVKLPFHEGFSVSLNVAKKWIKSSLGFNPDELRKYTDFAVSLKCFSLSYSGYRMGKVQKEIINHTMNPDTRRSAHLCAPTHVPHLNIKFWSSLSTGVSSEQSSSALVGRVPWG